MNTGEEFKFGLELFKETYQYKPYESLKECNLPILFVHGDKDSALPYELSEKVSKQCSNSIFKLIKNGEHTFMNSNTAINEAIDVTINFIKNIN
jgi:pimeloyl-ACP methyl ester carboxylesterase